jgi:hypothetical protein
MKKILIIAGIILLVVAIGGWFYPGQPTQIKTLGQSNLGQIAIFDSATAIGTGTTAYVGEFNNCTITTIGKMASSADAIAYKIMGSSADDTPNFNSTSTPNSWDFIQTIDKSNAVTVTGITGTTTGTTVVASGTVINIVKRLLVNDNTIKWLNVGITGYTNNSYIDATSSFSAIVDCNKGRI